MPLFIAQHKPNKVFQSQTFNVIINQLKSHMLNLHNCNLYNYKDKFRLVCTKYIIFICVDS